MMIDLLTSSNTGTYNIKAAKLVGLSTSVYLNELINIYYKAINKSKVNEKGYFKLQRDYVASRTTLTIREQREADEKLVELNILNLDKENKDTLKLDLDIYASIITNQDSKTLTKVASLVNKKSKEEKKEDKERSVILNLQKAIECPVPELREVYDEWVESMVKNPKYGVLDKAKARLFEEDINRLAQGNLDIALSLIKESIKGSYLNAQWAWNNLLRNKNNLRTTQVRVSQPLELSKESY